MREALRELESLRFVASAPFRGTWVREVSDEELVEVYPIRAALEEVAARAAAERLGGDVEALEREVRAMAKAADVRDQVDHDVRFHELIVDASGNRRLGELWRSLQVEARTMITALRTRPRRQGGRSAPRADRGSAAPPGPRRGGKEIRRHVEEFGRMVLERRAEPPTGPS